MIMAPPVRTDGELNERLLAEMRLASLAIRGGLGIALLIPVIWALTLLGPFVAIGVWVIGSAVLMVLPGLVTKRWLRDKLVFTTDPRLADGAIRLGQATGLRIPPCVVTSGANSALAQVVSEWPAYDVLVINHDVVTQWPRDEVFAILCHEASHVKHHDVLKRRIIGAGLALLLALALGLLVSGVFPSLAAVSPWIPAVILGTIGAPTHGVVLALMTRHQERRADAFAVETAGKAAVLAALARTQHTRQSLKAGLLSTHDDYTARVAHVERL